MEQSTMPADERNWGMACHLTALVGFIGPLIIWLIKKDQYPFVNDQGKEALNFQITMVIGWFAAGLLSFVLIGFFLFPVLAVLNLVFIIIGAVQASKGVAYRYPFALRLVK